MKQSMLLIAAACSLWLPSKTNAQTGNAHFDNAAPFLKEAIRSPAVSLAVYCEKIDKDMRRIFYLNNKNGKMQLQVRGIYTHGTTLFFSLCLNNRSHLDYDVDSIRFSIIDKGGKTSPQSRLKVLAPVYVYDSTIQVKGRSKETSVIVLPRFTLPANKRLLIEVLEKNGGRHLQVETSNFILERARLI